MPNPSDTSSRSERAAKVTAALKPSTGSPDAAAAAAARCDPVGVTCFISETLDIFEKRLDANSNFVWDRDRDTRSSATFSDVIAAAWDQQFLLTHIHNEIQALGKTALAIWRDAGEDGGWFDTLATRLETRLVNLDTSLVATWREVLEPELVRDLALAVGGSATSDTTLKDFIHPDLAGINDNLTIGLGRIREELRYSTDTQDLRAFDSVTLLLQRLDELITATGAQGGLDIEEWAAALEPHSAPTPQGKVQATDNISPWIKAPSGFWAFVVDRLGVMFKDFYAATSAAAESMTPVFHPLIQSVVDQVQERGTNLGNVTPSDAFPLARRFIEEAFVNGLKARMISILLEKLGDQSKNLGIQQIAGLVGDLSGFSQLAEAIHGTQLKAAVARPAEYQINAQTRTRLLNPGETIEAAIERKLSLEEQREILRFHGYTEHHIDIIQRYQWTDPRLREIILLASDSSVDDDDVRHWLAESGYEDQDIDRMAPVVIQQSNRQHRQALTSEIMSNLQEGFLTEEDAEAQFDRLRYSEEAKRLLIDTGRFKFRRELIQAHITELEQMFQLQQIKEPELRLALEGLGVRKDKIDAIAGKAFSKFIGRVSKEEEAQTDKDVRELQQTTLAALRAQFQARLLPAAAFEGNLLAIGFLPQIAREIVALEQIKLLTKDAGEKSDDAERLRDEIRRARIAAFVELFQDGFLNEAQLRANLLALGLAPELADALVFREVAKKFELPKPTKPPTTH